jgi:dTDP-glucose 4,6-dehydratase
MRFAVTGGLGFIGCELVPRLLADGRVTSVVVVDNESYAAVVERLAEYRLDSRFSYRCIDVRTRPAVVDALADTDFVVHLAAESYVDRAITASLPCWETNVFGTHHVVEAVRRTGATLVHASTEEVFGEALDETEHDEASPYRPRNPYAASKASADHLIRAAANTYEVAARIVHFAAIYGPFQRPGKLAPSAIARSLAGLPVLIYDEGEQIREWTFVSDAVDALCAVIWSGRDGEAYNVGSGARRRNIELVRLLLDLVGDSSAGYELFAGTRPGHDFRYALDSRKIRAELGWEPEVTLEDGFARTVEWYRSNADWIARRGLSWDSDAEPRGRHQLTAPSALSPDHRY